MTYCPRSYILHTLTWFDFHDHRFAILIPHLSDIQQVVRIAIVSRPGVHEHPRATAPTIHHHTVVQVEVTCVCRLNIRHSGDPSEKESRHSGHRFCLSVQKRLDCSCVFLLKIDAQESDLW